ncbi:polysaccharide biosynthesis tyrosine autokinase [Dyadobacter chenwenxiniae]|uniref:non-specific protein-tyrosine kinase n=1 Tax=Dyadobacter chenwenxiniae TaxID=2906456 RepID=A0A9X1PKN5_9BACT|nr:tyrosine-protein kinase [Dyadobacter chenwenxiniae]MCF0062678.1 polysaccharide biosynthesis tyrosine autokinase [Dyadobacter chenwenxiniae]UON83577.1 polysaccharide biosynthesis tyrosine autokinase [Dyadobacter chenwenxiniae]
MTTQQATLATFTLPQAKRESFDIKNIINKYLYHWPLFVISLSISIAAIIFYLKIAKPVYEVNATIVIKDEKKNQNQSSPLHEIDALSSSRIIENEIEVFKSKQLINQVVGELLLNIGYQKIDGPFSQELYNSAPVKLTVVKSGNADGTLLITIKDKNSFLIEMPDKTNQTFSFKDEFKNKFGTWKLEPTDKLDAFVGKQIKISITDPENTALQYQKKLSVALSNKLSTTVILSIDDEIPQRGKDILNRLIFNYNLTGTMQRNREARNTLDFIDKRLASLSTELNEAEKGIEVFKSARGLTDISSNSKISLENMQTNDARLNEVNVQLSVVQEIEKYINSAQNRDKTPTTLGIDDPALRSMIEKLAQLQLQRERLLATTPETNPDFEPINRQIVTTKAAIRENVGSIRASLQNTQRKLLSFNQNFESSIKNIPTQERQYISIKRQQAIKETLYTYLLQKREEISVSYASKLAEDRIVDHAYSGPAKQTQRSMAFAGALLIGLGLPIGLIYVRGLFSAKIKNIQEIKDVVDLAVVAELPLEKSSATLKIENNKATAIAEQFRSLRLKLSYLSGNSTTGRVTLVTSSVPGEGKSFVSSNLAVSLALSGRKTIILELDLRKPKLSSIFATDTLMPGISDYLNGEASLENIIKQSVTESGLDLISSGERIPNPSELLETPQLGYLIEYLRSNYDDIIIDSPPVHLVSDAMIISRFADITLYMIRQGVTEKAELSFLKEIQEQKNLKNVNIVFNGIQRLKYGYGYNYNANYYYDSKHKSIASPFSDFFGRF